MVGSVDRRMGRGMDGVDECRTMQGRGEGRPAGEEGLFRALVG